MNMLCFLKYLVLWKVCAPLLPAEPVLLCTRVLSQHIVLLLQTKTQVLQLLPGKPKQALRICGERERKRQQQI